MPHISIISPVYKAARILPELVSRLETALIKITPEFEIILVEDGSPDHSWDVIERLSMNKLYLKGIQLSKNYGQHYAISCGLNYAKGDWIVVMDCDLQDLPEEIEKLYNKTKEGYKVVFAKRAIRNDHFFKKSSSILFAKCFYFFTGYKHDQSISNFGIYASEIIRSLINNKQLEPFYPAMLQSLDIKQSKIEVKHSKREGGQSSYNWFKLLKLAILTILKFVKGPRQLISKISFLIVSFSIIFILGYGIKVNFNMTLIGNSIYVFLFSFLIIGLIIIAIGITTILFLSYFTKTTSEVSNPVSKIINL